MHALRILAGLIVAAAIGAASPAAAVTPCPSTVLFEPDATGSRLDAGWVGYAHDLPIVGPTFRMALSCAASTPPCGVCAITGLEPNAGGNNQRCTNDSSIICTTATEVTDCGAPGLCRFFASPPTGVATGGITTCYTTEVTGPVTGSVDVDTGALSPDVPLRAALYSGVIIDNPCPRCLNDPSPNDNVRGGTCDAGARNGLGCDANATAEYPDFGSTSFDCPPITNALISELVVGPVHFSTDTQSRTLSTASPNCSGQPGAKCFCDSCNNGAAEPCQQNADCPDPAGPIGPICGGRRCVGGGNEGTACTTASECPAGFCVRPGEPTKPNSCVDDSSTPGPSCVDTPPVDGEGECAPDGPYNTTCTVASGHPQRGCTFDGDCGGAFGSCTSSPRKCYTDLGVLGGSISVSGVATPPAGNTSDPTELTALVCLPPTFSSAVNVVAGFPGLARANYPGHATFAEKIVVEVATPGGTVTTVGAGPTSVVETTVTTPTGGEVQIVGTFATGTPPAGYTFLGRLVQIDALPASAATPLQIAFDIDASEVPPGQNESTIDVFRNGAGPIPNCLGATQASPDPCITARTALAGGDVRITALTSAASEWTLAALTQEFCPLTIDSGCRSPFVGGKAQLSFTDKTPDSKDQLQWKWAAGAATTVAEFGNPLATDAYALCIYNPSRTASLLAPAGGTCAGKPCWTAKPTGFVYKDKDLTPFGIAQLSLKAGADGKAQIQLKGKGANLEMPAVGSAMTAQLRNLTSGQCWTATYSAPFKKNDGVSFKDTAD